MTPLAREIRKRIANIQVAKITSMGSMPVHHFVSSDVLDRIAMVAEAVMLGEDSKAIETQGASFSINERDELYGCTRWR